MNTSIRYPRRLIEVDLPIKRISAHARREKSIRHGHISTLHIWWARRPLAACRAVICAALWPDPADELCPQRFRDDAFRIMAELRGRVLNGKLSEDQRAAREPVGRIHVPDKPGDYAGLRRALLDFIAEFANWDLSTNRFFLEASRALTQSAHEALGGAPGTRPLVVDPFAGGGSIPLEALRVGADAFASDLNPIPVLLNKVVLEYIPKYGQRLADEVRKWGQWIKEQAEKELAAFYPKDLPTKDLPGGATPIAYLWARTIISEAPGESDIPVEVPLMRSLWLAKKAGRRRALRWVRDENGQVQTETVAVTYVVDGQAVATRVRRPLLEIFEPKKESEVEGGTVARGSATCPVTGYTTKVDSVRAQLKQRRGGAADARLFAVVTTRSNEKGRFYRLPTAADQAAFDAAAAELERRERADGTERSRKGRAAASRSAAASAEGAENRHSLVPDEVISLNELRRISVPIYGMERWGDLFSPRQALALTTLARLVREAAAQCARDQDAGFAGAVATCLACALARIVDQLSTLVTWVPSIEVVTHTFTRQALGMAWDYVEPQIFAGSGGDFFGAVTWVEKVCSDCARSVDHAGQIELASATAHPLPDDAAVALITDPPYYDAVPYAYLSDFFYVWMRRTLADVHPDLFRETGAPKDAEIVVDRPHKLSQSTKDIAFYERELTRAFDEGRRVLAPAGVGTIVFASKTTASWEAVLKAVIDAGFVITGSWPIDTEREVRVAAQGQARLGSSIHIVVRPRENPDASIRTDEIGDWRDVLAELPKRIHAWLPRLAKEGIVGADAIFACLGPALEIYSRYSHVEKASGGAVPLGDYLEHVWAAVAKEALDTIFKGADTRGFEQDARLTAIWFWVMKEANGNGNGRTKNNSSTAAESDTAEAEAEGTDAEENGTPVVTKKGRDYAMEFDAARKLAQGLGADLTELSRPGGILSIQGNTATLVGIQRREGRLIGTQASLFGETGDETVRGARRRAGRARLKAVRARGPTLFDPEPDVPDDPNQPFIPGLEPPRDERTLMQRLQENGETVLDRLHQAMILFGRGQTALLRPFLIETGTGQSDPFWMLAQALSALYPSGTDEKRWVDGVLARKKGLGF